MCPRTSQGYKEGLWQRNKELKKDKVQQNQKLTDRLQEALQNKEKNRDKFKDRGRDI